MKNTLVALALSLPLLAYAKTDNAQKVTSQVSIYNQVVGAKLPAHFVVGHKQQSNTSFIMEFVPQGQSVENWLEMITYTGLESAIKNKVVDSRGMIVSIGTGYQNACANTFSAKKILEENKKVAFVFSCGDNGQQKSETALILALEGTNDVYTVQWAERGKKSNTPLVIDEQKWAMRLNSLDVQLLPSVK